MKSIELIAWAWPLEVIVVVGAWAAGPSVLEPDVYKTLVGGIPALVPVIGGQAAVAYFGKQKQDEQAR